MLNINTATAEEIDAIALLEGHGYEITRYRDERGGFSEYVSLMRCPDWQAKPPESNNRCA